MTKIFILGTSTYGTFVQSTTTRSQQEADDWIMRTSAPPECMNVYGVRYINEAVQDAAQQEAKAAKPKTNQQVGIDVLRDLAANAEDQAIRLQAAQFLANYLPAG